MKRKLFTLFLAFVALGAFQANAQALPQYWIKVDTTGINGNAIYPGDKLSYLNEGTIDNNKWLTYTNKFTVSPSTNDVLGIYKDKPADVFNLTKSSGVDGRFLIKSIGGQQLALPNPGAGSVTVTEFEIVQFWGNNRTIQTMANSIDMGSPLSGYLAPPQGGTITKQAFDTDLLLVGSTGQGSNLSTKRISEYGSLTTGTPILLDEGWVSYQNTSKTFLRNRIYLSPYGFDILDSKGKWIIKDSIFGGAAAYDVINEETTNSLALASNGYNYAYLDVYGNTQGKFWKNPLYSETASGDTLNITTYAVAAPGIPGDLVSVASENPAGLVASWGHFYLKLESNGSLSLTFQHGSWTSNARTWSNGTPTRFTDGNYYYFNLNVGGVPSPASAVDVATAQANLQASTLFSDLFTGYTGGDKFIYKDNNNGWQPLWVEIEPICADPKEFITPAWLAANKLLSLPLSNQVYSLGAPVNAWISIGAGDDTKKDAIIANVAPTDASDELIHTYVVSTDAVTGTLTLGSGVLQHFIGGDVYFGSDVDVPLYNVQNKDGYYLTVVPNGIPTSTSAIPGINGVQLQWVNEKYEYDAEDGYDKTVFQLFAVAGYQVKESDPYGEFSYYPLASYRWDYTASTILLDQEADPENDIPEIPVILYNVTLGGLTTVSTCLEEANLAEAFNVGYYSAIGSSVKQLVVYAPATSGFGNITPIEVKLTHKNILKPIADYVYVQNNNAGANVDKFYTIDSLTDLDPTKVSSSWDLTSHWKLGYDDAADDKVLTFEQELKKVYTTTLTQTILANEYYALKYLAGSPEALEAGEGPLTVVFINLSGLVAPGYVASYDTLTLYPATHDVPFLDLEKAGYNLAEKFAILEAPFVDRNLTDYVAGDAPTPSYNPVVSYKTYIARVGEGYNETSFLTVYPVNERALTEEHIVPYYVFSITAADGKEYFLNVKTTGATDTVLWTTMTATEREALLDWNKKVGTTYPNLDVKPTYKFALPYQVIADSTLVAGIDYNGASRTPVYLQSYVPSTTTLNDANPYLIISGSATKYVNVVRYANAFNGAAPAWKIYSGDYSNINPEKLTSWIFGAQKPADQEWIPLLTSKESDVIGSTTGVLTNQELGGGGVTFIANSHAQDLGLETVNYGALVGLANAKDLVFEFVGDTVIGNYTQKPIWYYKISVDGAYLSDTTTVRAADDQKYLFNGVHYDYAAFSDDKLPAYAGYQGVPADSAFQQTFGFLAVGDTQGDPANYDFLIVSHANYKSASPVAGYRYLAEINNRLVFVPNKADALVFRFGKNDGGYTDITVVGKTGIYGVDGGVKVLNGEGKVDIYSIDGRLVKSTVITGADQTIAAPKGIVIVKNGSKVAKVFVK